MKRLLVLALSLALGLTGTACTDSTGPGASLAGTYTLQRVNGIAPPVVVYQSTQLTSEVVSGQIVLDAAGNYQGTTRYRDTYYGAQPVLSNDVITGYWTLSGNRLALTDRNYPNDPYMATVSGSMITLTDYSTGSAVVLVYSR